MKSYDLNKDNTIDRFEYSLDGQIIRIEEDQNNDKKIDRIVNFKKDGFYKIETQDTNLDGKIDRKKSFLKIDKNKVRVTTEIDKNEDGVYEIRYDQENSLNQKQTCDSDVQFIQKKLEDFSMVSLDIVSKNENGLIKTGYGYQVDYECYKKWGTDFTQIIKDSVQTGLQCLINLDKESPNKKSESGALVNAFNLSKLMENDSISLICSEDKDYEWSGTMAHASAASDQRIESKNISHPFVSLNPAHPENPSGKREAEIKEVKSTIFHETLHNLGYLHGESIEYPYSCEVCCFSEQGTQELKDKACKICTGNYVNETDLLYIKDFYAFSKEQNSEENAIPTVIKYLKENINSITGISILAAAQAGVFNPVGSHLSQLVSKTNKEIEASEKLFLENATLYKLDEYKNIQTTAKVLADSLYHLYFRQDIEMAISSIEKNKESIKKQLTYLKSLDGNNQYVFDSTKKVLDDLIYDMWINEYLSTKKDQNPTSNRAYELYDFFEK